MGLWHDSQSIDLIIPPLSISDMAYTSLSPLSVSAPLVNDLSHRRFLLKSSFNSSANGKNLTNIVRFNRRELRTPSDEYLMQPSNHESFLEKRTSGGGLNFKISENNSAGTRTRVFRPSIVCAKESSRKLVRPLVLEEALRPPTNLYTAEAPHTATFLSVEKIGEDPDGKQTYHVVFHHGGFVPHWEGQVFGVFPPSAENSFEVGDATKLRLYSVASSRYGDYYDGNTASLCVVRGSAGSTSYFLCTAKPGDKLQITGPAREALLLGDHNNPNGVHIMLATGTGIAPFRAHLRRFFAEHIPKFKFSGLAWLFAGHSSQSSQLYKQEFTQYAEEYPTNFRYEVALSDEQKNKSGGKLYVQDIFEDHAEEIFDLLNEGAYIYISGLKATVAPVQAAFEAVAKKRGLDWELTFDSYKRNNQWRVEVY